MVDIDNTPSTVDQQIIKNQNIDTSELQKLQQPPDGGWGWVVVFGSFMIHVITDGLTGTFGIFYIEFLNHFNEGKSYTAWIFSILIGVTYCSGPISSAFVNKYGCRSVTIAGSLLAGFCMIASVWATNVLTLIFTIGIGTGFGLGLIYLPAIVSVTMYFEKYRSLATGIAVCGSGFGTFIFAPLTEYLIEQFTWHGALLIIAGLLFNCIVCGALFRPIDVGGINNIVDNNSENIYLSVTDDSELPELKSGDRFIDNNKNKLTNTRNNCIITITKDIMMIRSKSHGHSLMKHDSNYHKHQQHHQNYNNDTSVNHSRTLSQPHIVYLSPERRQSGVSTFNALSRPDIFYQGSLYNIPQYCSTHNFNSISNIDESIDQTQTTFMEMMNFNLLYDPVFVIFTISNFCTSIGSNVPYIYLVAQADTLGIPTDKASYLLALIGIANTIGRIILGYLADKPWVNRLLVYNICLTCCGIASIFSIFCVNFYTLAIYAIIFGFTIGAFLGLTSVILVDLLGLDKLTNSFGLLLMFQGVASLIGPPLAGAFYDLTLSYAPGFILCGVTIAISGIILFTIPLIQRYHAQKHI